MHRTTQMKLTDLNSHITCRLCGGYFVDATTIAECLHSFCKSCIVTHLNRSKFCPICDVQVHKTKPLLNIRSDQTLQDIVYKLVPGLFQREMNRRRAYYKAHPEYVPASNEDCGEVSIQRFSCTPEDSISLSLEFHPTGTPYHQLSTIKTEAWGSQRRFFSCPAAVTIHHLKKMVRKKFSLTSREQIDIMYSDDPLPDSNTLMDIAFIYAWRRNAPMRLFYRIYISGSPSKKRKLSVGAQPEDVPSICKVESSTETILEPAAKVKSEPMDLDVGKEVAECGVSRDLLGKKKLKMEEVKNGTLNDLKSPAPKVTSEPEEDGNVVQLEISESGEMKAMKAGETVLSCGNKPKAQDLDLIMRSVVSQFPSKPETPVRTSLMSASSNVKMEGQKPQKLLTHSSSKALPSSLSSLKSQTVPISLSVGGSMRPSVSKPSSSNVQSATPVPLQSRLLPKTTPRSHIPTFSTPCTSYNLSVSKPVYHGRASVASSAQSVTISPVSSLSSKFKSYSQPSPVNASQPPVPKSTVAISVLSSASSSPSSPRPSVSASNVMRSQSPHRYPANLNSPQRIPGIPQLPTTTSSQVTSAIAGMELDRSFVPSPSTLKMKDNTIPKQTHRSRLGPKTEIPSVQMLNLNRTTHLSMTKSEPSTKGTETPTTTSSSDSVVTKVSATATSNTDSGNKDIVEISRVQGNGTPKKSAADVLMTITEKAVFKTCGSPGAFPNNYYSSVDSTDVKGKPDSRPQSEDKTSSQKDKIVKVPCTNVSSGTPKTSTTIGSTIETKPKPSPLVQSTVTSAAAAKPPTSISTSLSHPVVSSPSKKSDLLENNQMPQDLSIVSKKVEPRKPPSLKPIAPHPSQVVGTTKASIMSSKNFKSRSQPKVFGNPSERVKPTYPGSAQTSPSKQGGVLKVDPRTLNPVWGPHVQTSEQCKATATSAESLLSTTLLPNTLSCFPPYNGVGKPPLGGMSPRRHPSVTTQPMVPWSLMGAKASELNLHTGLFSSMPHPSYLPQYSYMMGSPPFSPPTPVPPDVNRNYPATPASSTESKKIEKLTNGSVQQNA